MNMKLSNIFFIFQFLTTTVVLSAQDSVHYACDSVPVTTKYINVAFGKVTKEKLINSVSQIGGENTINNSVFSTGNSLYGKLPGLFVMPRTGEPGNDAPDLFIRGLSSTGKNAPLVIVDGIERDLNHVPIEDIEAISVLKDAASCVIYGIRGANGVIVVTTKRGRDGKLSLNGNFEQGVFSAIRTPGFVTAANYAQLYNQALINDGLDPLYSQEQISGYENGSSIIYPDVDWQREVTRNYASGTKANMNISGGDRVAKYFVSLGYFRQGGIYKEIDNDDAYSTNVNLTNFTFRSNLDINMNKNWKVGLDIAGRVYQKNEPFASANNIWDVMYKYPSHLFPVFVQDQEYGGTSYFVNNPVGYVNSRGYRQTNNRLIQSTLFTRYNLNSVLKGLSAGLKYSTDNFYTNQEGYTKTFSVKEIIGLDAIGRPILSSPIGTNTNISPLTNSGYPTNDIQNKRNTFEGDIYYSPYIAKNQQLTTQILYHQDRLIIGSESPYNFQFISGRANYDYNSKYLIEFAASYSGTEAFPKNKRYGFFPAGAVGWMISNEPFLKGKLALNSLKLYFSAGSVGNATLGERFSDLRQYVSGSSYSFGNANASQSGLSSGLLSNPGFTWETAHKYDVGVDVRLLKMVDFSIVYFKQNRKNILISDATLTPAIIGASLANINAVSVKSNGLEMHTSISQQSKQWGYNAGISATYATSQISEMPEAGQPYPYLYRKGYPLNQPFLLEAIGFFESEADIQNSPLQEFGIVKPGDIKYKDQNNDGHINEFDLYPLRNSPFPKWDFGIDLGGRYHSLEVSVFFQGQAARSIYLGNEPLIFWPLSNNGARITSYANHFWTEQNRTNADYPRLSTMENFNNYRASTFWYRNGAFLRLRSLNISWSLPESKLRQIRLQKAVIFLRGMNLSTWDYLKYADPEVLAGYPVMKSYNAGIRLWL